jgi:hypothetical protein
MQKIQTDEKLDKISYRLETYPRESLACLSQKTRASASSDECNKISAFVSLQDSRGSQAIGYISRNKTEFCEMVPSCRAWWEVGEKSYIHSVQPCN